MLPYGETVLSDFDTGLFTGILVGEGHFGGDGKQPQITLRMHSRHLAIFDWLIERFPRTRLYGPYFHGGRDYMQWMARGRALVEDVIPVLEQSLSDDIDEHSYARYRKMLKDYRHYFVQHGLAEAGTADK